MLLNRIVRIMTFAPFTIDTKPIFDFLQIQDFQQLFSFETGNFTYRLKNNLLPTNNLVHHFARNPAQHNYNLRNRDNRPIVAPICLLSSFKKKSLYVRGMDMWNDIPDFIKSSESIRVFKKKYKSQLFT